MTKLNLHTTALLAVSVVCVCLPVILQTLQSPPIGITAAFDSKVADFTKISDTPLFVTKVMQSVSGLAHQPLCKHRDLGPGVWATWNKADDHAFTW